MRTTKTLTIRDIALAATVDRSLPKMIVALAQDWLRLNPEPAELPELTARQREVFGFIQSTIAQRQTSPTVREIGAEMGISSPNGVMCHLRALKKKGVIEHIESVSRGVRIAQAYRT